MEVQTYGEKTQARKNVEKLKKQPRKTKIKNFPPVACPVQN